MRIIQLMFVLLFVFFLAAIMSFPRVRSGVTAPWNNERSISTMNVKVLLNYRTLFLFVFIFGSFWLRERLSTSLHLWSVALGSDLQEEDMMDTSAQNSFSWKGFISRVELKVLLNSSNYLTIISTSHHRLKLVDVTND